MVETDEMLALLQRVAAEVVTPRFRALEPDQVGEKSPGDLVTIADREAEVAITAALRAAYPEAMVLGEEATAGDPGLIGRFRSAQHAFTVDPVDGTKNFVHGSPDHAVMVAELLEHTVVRSWIWQPQHQTSYVAEKGAGAWRNGERLLRPPTTEPLRGVTSRRAWIGSELPDLSPLELTWVCCGIDYPRIAEGAADYALYYGSQPWDHAPGQLLLEEAGGTLGTFAGGPYDAQREPPVGLVAAGDTVTYELVRGLVGELPGM